MKEEGCSFKNIQFQKEEARENSQSLFLWRQPRFCKCILDKCSSSKIMTKSDLHRGAMSHYDCLEGPDPHCWRFGSREERLGEGDPFGFVLTNEGPDLTAGGAWTTLPSAPLWPSLPLMTETLSFQRVYGHFTHSISLHAHNGPTEQVRVPHLFLYTQSDWNIATTIHFLSSVAALML
ncbi:hypothetical protein HJG60_010788 [Phyllostomus discolor]|uniref:Uncharacterized protein n=1 Tax=Phyllostomus discolor TaxID=89673 RepID=A0A834ABW0_9CHIR|nr:hypothetical protein HJG60_010788 [Phyllostomus discolor]